MKRWAIERALYWNLERHNRPDAAADNAKLKRLLDESWEPFAVVADGYFDAQVVLLRKHLLDAEAEYQQGRLPA